MLFTHVTYVKQRQAKSYLLFAPMTGHVSNRPAGCVAIDHYVELNDVKMAAVLSYLRRYATKT